MYGLVQELRQLLKVLIAQEQRRILNFRSTDVAKKQLHNVLQCGINTRQYLV